MSIEGGCGACRKTGRARWVGGEWCGEERSASLAVS